MAPHLTPRHDGHWLVYQTTLQAPVRPGAASKTVIEYLESIGFELTRSSPSLFFERGGWLASLYNPDPRSQQTYITADVLSGGDGSAIELSMRVNRMGNLPLRRDYEFWQTELNGMEQALQHGYADPRLSEYAADRARLYSIMVMQWVLLAVLTLLLVMTISLLAL